MYLHIAMSMKKFFALVFVEQHRIERRCIHFSKTKRNRSWQIAVVMQQIYKIIWDIPIYIKHIRNDSVKEYLETWCTVKYLRHFKIHIQSENFEGSLFISLRGFRYDQGDIFQFTECTCISTLQCLWKNSSH
jgi:stress-induced morphogen